MYAIAFTIGCISIALLIFLINKIIQLLKSIKVFHDIEKLGFNRDYQITHLVILIRQYFFLAVMALMLGIFLISLSIKLC
jgi:hypothetical protein